MPAELDRNAQTGQAAMFAVVRTEADTPWHREGSMLTEAPSMEQALILAGVDWTVQLRPVFMAEQHPIVGGPQDGAMATEYVQSPTGRLVVRSDRAGAESVLAVVGDGYAPLQNRDAFAVLEPLLDRGVATLETGGSLRGGKDVWMLVRFKVDDPVVREVFADEVIPFGLLTNNHSSQRRAILMETPVRVVCANTLRAALSGVCKENAVAVVHRGDARVRLVEAAEQLFAGLIERYVAVAEQYRLMKQTILTVDEFVASILDTTYPMPAKPEAETKVAVSAWERASERTGAARSTIQRLWVEGAGHRGDHSAWEGFNALVEVLDHDLEVSVVRGSRVESMLRGRIATRKDDALDAVLAVCRSR